MASLFADSNKSRSQSALGGRMLMSVATIITVRVTLLPASGYSDLNARPLLLFFGPFIRKGHA
jgi:hypothetical protein